MRSKRRRKMLRLCTTTKKKLRAIPKLSAKLEQNADITHRAQEWLSAL
jgi:hypothetical protein